MRGSVSGPPYVLSPQIAIMRIFTLSIAALLSFAMSAQTYFYIHTISVDPANPTTSDMVSIQLSGDLSSTGSSITAASAEVVGNTVNISITAVHEIGLDVLVAHTEPIEIGMLAAGDYEIVVLGTNVDDFAASVEHQFTVTGGSPCDDLVIDFVRWEAFSDTAVIVHVVNNSNELFDYPGFVLLDMNGDTLAKETVNFFGIGLDNYHTLTIQPGAVFPFGTSSYVLHLWTHFYEEQACTWQLNVDLCPLPPCDQVAVGLQNFGDALTIGNFDWTILDVDMESVGNGQLTLTDSVQYDWDTLCLPPGQYRLLLTPLQQSTGGQPYFGVDETQTSGWFRGPNAPLEGEAAAEIDFEFYPACTNGANTVQESIGGEAIQLSQDGRGINVRRSDGKPIGMVLLYDAQGRMLRTARSNTDRMDLDMSAVPTGVYLLRLENSIRRMLWAK